LTDSQKPLDPNMDDDVERDDAVIGKALRGSLAALVLLAALGGGAAYWRLRPVKFEAADVKPAILPERRDRGSVELPKLSFTDVTQESGIAFVHENGAYGDKLLPETMGGGCAFFDYDNDGDQDLFLVDSTYWPGHEPAGKPAPTSALYRNDGRGNFEDVTEACGLDFSCYGMGAAVGDYDNDGWVDLFVSAVGKNRLFHNQEGRFTEITDAAGVGGDAEAWSTCCGWFDYDNDGDLDLFVGNYLRWTREIDLSLHCTLKGEGRAYCRPDAFQGAFPYLYRNDGGGKFADVSETAGVQVRNPDTGVPLAKSLGLTFADLDADGWMDIVVANDTVQNLLFRNRGDGGFDEIGTISGLAFDAEGRARGAMGIDAARFRNDETLGLAIGNFANEMTAMYVSQGRAMQFADDAIATGIGPPSRLMLKFGVFFFDCDLDRRLDVFTANGHLEEDIQKVQQSQHYEQPPHLYWNCGAEADSEFLLVPPELCGDDFSKPMVGRGAAFADIDGDGDLDVLVTSARGAPRLLRNDQQLGRHWLRVKLIGKNCNRDAIGAWVEVRVAGETLSRQVMPTRSYLSQVELPVTFGLGDAEGIESLSVHWPDGSTQKVAPGDVDRLLTIEQATPGESQAGTRP